MTAQARTRRGHQQKQVAETLGDLNFASDVVEAQAAAANASALAARASRIGGPNKHLGRAVLANLRTSLNHPT